MELATDKTLRCGSHIDGDIGLSRFNNFNGVIDGRMWGPCGRNLGPGEPKSG
jgi:hypothetical protein